MVAMAYRFVNTIINRCHLPGDGYILVPVGTVAVIGTTSVDVSDPNDTSIQAWADLSDRLGVPAFEIPPCRPAYRGCGVSSRAILYQRESANVYQP